MLVTICLAIGLAGAPGLEADTAREAPDLQEVCELLRTHVAGLSKQELDRTAVAALVNALGPRVTLITNGVASSNIGASGSLTKSTLFDGEIAYLRVEEIGEGLAKTLRQSLEKLGTNAKLKGIVLDLRYSRGTDYAAAEAIADLFVKKERPLLNWGTGLVSSTEKNDAITIPVAVLVNGQTAGAPEAVAGMLRMLGAGLILGNQTAGQALIAQEFRLKNGDRLRIGIAPIALGDGSELGASGVKPDITVEVSSQDERVYYADAFKVIPKPAAGSSLLTGGVASTNRAARRPRFNEAELVRERREGYNPDTDLPAPSDNEPEKPLVHDPALARALDLLKGLAVVREAHS
jgi:hypothetical protein